MKKISLLLVGALISTFSFAGKEDPNPKSVSGMKVVRRDAYSYKLIYKSEESSDVKVEIFDSKEKLVFTETIKKSNGFARPYSFENLSEGEYTIRIDNGSNWMTETVDYSSEKTPKLAHVVRVSDGKYMLTVPGRGEDLLSVQIFNQAGEMVYTDSTPVYGDYSTIFDMGAMKGPFSFEVTDKSGISAQINKK